MGRKKLWAERLTLPISTEMLEKIDAMLAGDETRLDLIREAIDRELRRRGRKS
jgi:metal-responsive CopG/Arc/MetJ family transcriptional regulator